MYGSYDAENTSLCC